MNEARELLRIARGLVSGRIEAPPRMVRSITKLVRDYFSKKQSGVVTKKVNWNLAGWKYQDLVERGRDFKELRRKFGKLWVRLLPSSEWDETISGEYSEGILSVYIDRKWGFDLNEIKDTIEHELIHYAQDILQSATGSEGAGLPSSSIRQPGVTQHLDRGDPLVKKLRKEGITPSLFHDLDDVEFYTELNKAVREVRRVISDVELENEGEQSADKRTEAFKILVGLGRRKGYIRPIPFMVRLRKGAPGKWKKAVKELARELL